MPSPRTLDLDALLAPISEDAPAGVDLRSDPQVSKRYYALKDARGSARSLERNNLAEEGESTDMSGEWAPVLDQACELISHHSKDLEVTAWLIEALARLRGFPGLRDGFVLTQGLVEQYWDNIYPRPDEDGVETTVAPLAGLNGTDSEGTLINPVRNIPITQGESGPFAAWHYEQASALEQLPADKRGARIESGAVTTDTLRRAAQQTPAGFFVGLSEDLKEAQAALKSLSDLLDEKAGTNAPSTAKIRNAFDSCALAIQFLGGDKIEAAMAGTEGDAHGGSADTTGGQDGTSNRVRGAGSVRTREDAFRALLEIAEFFRQTEPHSPLSYGIEQIVRWGRTPLPDLLKILILDNDAREQLCRLTGIPSPGDG